MAATVLYSIQFPQTPFKYFSFSQTSKTFSKSMASSLSDPIKPQQFQHVVVLRHGHRLDNFESDWTATAPRPWDPPLWKDGFVRAFETGRRIRNELGFPIHRVFVSPFLRCLQTAAEAVTAICAVDEISGGVGGGATSNGVVIDPSKIKVSIEYGLCEMLNTVAIRRDVAPKDGIFSFDIPLCESILPAGTVDNTVDPVYKELPQWPETPEGARDRYCNMVKALGDKYPSENLLLVTHAEGVASAISRFVPDIQLIYEVDYCAHSVLHRPIISGENQSFTPGDFFGSPEEQFGVKYQKRI